MIRHAVACAVLGCAFVIVGAPRVWEVRRTYSFGPIQPHHSTNSYMGGSERLLRALAALPPKRPIAVILPETDETSIFLSYLVTYFSWPRDARRVLVRRDNATSQMRSLDRESLGAIFFCGIDPQPGMEPVVRIGSGLLMVPMNAAEEGTVP